MVGMAEMRLCDKEAECRSEDERRRKWRELRGSDFGFRMRLTGMADAGSRELFSLDQNMFVDIVCRYSDGRQQSLVHHDKGTEPKDALNVIWRRYPWICSFLSQLHVNILHV